MILIKRIFFKKINNQTEVFIDERDITAIGFTISGITSEENYLVKLKIHILKYIFANICLVLILLVK